MNQSLILSALHKNYEDRSIREHKLIINALSESFPTHSEAQVKMMTYYIEIRQGPTTIEAKQYQKHSFVIRFKQSQDRCSSIVQLITLNGVEVNDGEFVGILDYQKYLNIEAFGQSSIEKQISFWESSQYFCSMPRKKLYQLLRQTEVKTFKENEIAYFQGQLVTKTQSGSGVFVVRKGQFGNYRTNQSQKEIQTFRYGPGSIFGALQILEQDPIRKMTARCKTQRSVIYHFSEEVFSRLISRYCENVIRTKQQKLFRYIENKKNNQMVKSRSLSDAMRKTTNLVSDKTTYSRPLMMNTQYESCKSTMIYSGRKELPNIKDEVRRITKGNRNYTAFRESSRMEQQGAKKSDYFSLRKAGPLKMYPMVSQRSNFVSSEFKVLDKLLLQRKQVGKQTRRLSNHIRQNGVWRRDMMSSFYRQTFFESIKRNPESVQL